MSQNEQAEGKSFKEAIDEIDVIMKRFDGMTRNKLVSHMLTTWLIEKTGTSDEQLELENGKDDKSDMTEILDDPITALDRIAALIKSKVPRSGILPSETLIPSVKELQKKSDDLDTTIEIDSFLYDDEDLDLLEDKGELSRYYCEACGSKKIKFLNIVSNSMSREELFNLFNDYLPVLDDKIVLDIGSRLGAVLYGAYVFSDAKKIIGVEMNKDFCDIQTEAINHFKMGNRIEVINKKIEDAADVLESADVVVFNNIFDSYLLEEKHAELWYFLKEHIKKGAYIVCRPAIEHAVNNLNLNINVDEWVKKVVGQNLIDSIEEVENVSFKMDLSSPKIPCYKVL